jgi:hypothetical protein
VGLNVPAFLLSRRLAKWYLYIPLLGLAFAFGVMAEHMQPRLPAKLQRIAGLCILVLLIGPLVFASHVQTRSYIASSDSAYQSDLLEACVKDFQAAHPALPPQVTLFFLPAFAVRRLYWKEVVADLGPYAGMDAQLILKCYNDPGGKTVADWLNWRAIDSRSDLCAKQN